MISWEPLSGVALPQGVTGHRASVQLPIYPEDTAKSNDTFGFSVSRLVRGSSPKAHVIMLAGGPGQKGTLYLKMSESVLSLIPGDVALYLPSHRGTGKSGKPTRSEFSYVNDQNKLPNSIPLDSITVQNAAWDVIKLALSIRAGPTFKPGHRIMVYGCSYGGLWATRAINLMPGLFDSALLNSPFVLRNFWDPLNDRDVLEACRKNSFCNSQVNENPEGIRNAISHLGNPNFNACSKAFHEELATRQEFSSIRGNDDADPYQQRMAGFINGVFKVGPKATMAGIAFVNHMYKCPDAAEFMRVLPTVFTLPFFSPDNTSMADAAELSDTDEPLLDSFGDGTSLHALVNMFVLGHEVYDLKSGYVHEICAAQSPFGLFNLCSSYWAYRRHWKQHFSNQHPLTSSIKMNSISTQKTRVLIFQGAMDSLTALPGVEQFYKDMSAPSKRLIVQKNLGHSGLFKSRCAKYVFSEFLGRSPAFITDMCVTLQNWRRPDWSLKKHPGMSEFWLKDPRKCRPLPTEPLRSATGYPSIRLSRQPQWATTQTINSIFAIAIVLGTAVILAVVIIILGIWVRRRRLAKLAFCA